MKHTGYVGGGAPNIYSQVGICPVIYLSSDDVKGTFDETLQAWILE